MKNLAQMYSKLNYMLLGLGESNKSAAKLLDLIDANYFCINRGPVKTWKGELPQNIKEENLYSEESLKEVPKIPDVVILSPGIPKDHYLLKPISKKVKIWTEIELAYKFCDIPIIGITGSNGKTTTTTILGEMLKHSNLNPFVGGNIGVPFCEMIIEEIQNKKKFDYAVLELSSFQLESIEEFAPNVAIILNITLNHQERYNTIEEYANAKFNITKNMNKNSALIYPRECQIIDRFAQRQVMTILPFNSFIINEEFKSKFNLSKLKLRGEHNLQNLYSSYKAINFLQLDETGVQKTIDLFEGVEYRIEQLKLPKYSFTIFNDAKSSNIDATKTAIFSFNKNNKTNSLYLIYGGQKRDKKEKLNFPNDLLPYLNKIFLIGETTDELFDTLSNTQHSVIVVKSYTIEDVKKSILQEKSFSGNLLFSPGFPSFDQFKHYKDRGAKFNHLWEDE